MATDSPRPNVVLILTDDQGYGDLSRTGNRMLRTPHIDTLKELGLYLQTQDARLRGTLKRSSIHPNCSWVCEWQERDDSLLWHIDVQTAGSYTLGVMYSAHSGQLGSRFAAECGTERCEFQVDEEFNHPELHGFDRHPRSESYEKEFALLECGVIALAAGPAEFVLKASAMAGDAMPHVRAFKLELS